MKDLRATVQSLHVGENSTGLVKASREFIEVDLSGVVGDKHAGYTRRADSRSKEYPQGVEIRNWRQWSAVSTEELARIAEQMGVSKIDPAWLGANLCLVGIPNLTQLPKGSRLTFPDGTVLEVEEENLPCINPGKVIRSQFPSCGIKPNLFVKVSMHLRGIVGVVNRAGIIRVGDQVQISVYQPGVYPGY